MTPLNRLRLPPVTWEYETEAWSSTAAMNRPDRPSREVGSPGEVPDLLPLGLHREALVGRVLDELILQPAERLRQCALAVGRGA
jgi:hypothetical protein